METQEIADKIKDINIEDIKNNKENLPKKSKTEQSENSEALAQILGTEILNITYPRLMKVKPQLKELISKQNKIYLDISAEKFKYTDNNIYIVENLMERVKFYREKLIKIRRAMIDIHHKSRSLKNRAINLRKQAENKVNKN
ncbi:biogenesis of lysosome-related organelles complex 1 subunit 6 [Condylostylus longicornis]|uniref:biogenesis of lysosome-related organelles complex 1 subunit 6 n=1 Tax=Condylostylus longicornis TaxID=2530218 RepID=UPI00244DAB69|nr:biogenesis of lysosome-related organelles complex 1 subunit 6 [Condylostylus longicornis]